MRQLIQRGRLRVIGLWDGYRFVDSALIGASKKGEVTTEGRMDETGRFDAGAGSSKTWKPNEVLSPQRLAPCLLGSHGAQTTNRD